MKEIRQFGNNLTTAREKVLFDIFKALEELPWAIKQALDKRLTALDANKADRRDTQRDYEILSSLLHSDSENLDKRLTALEAQAVPFDGWFENLHKRVNRLEPVHNEPNPLACEGCAELNSCTSDHDTANCLSCEEGSKPPCYREKHTCGECRFYYFAKHISHFQGVCYHDIKENRTAFLLPHHECVTGNFEAGEDK